MKYPVFDFHCDTALALLGHDMNQAGQLRRNSNHIDLERASCFDSFCQCFACFTTTLTEFQGGISPVLAFERELVSLQREFDRNQDLISQVYEISEVEENRRRGKMSAILTLEGTAGINHDPDLLENLYQIGFRIVSLGWNEVNPLTGSCWTGGGLTDLGREFVKEAQRLGMLIDVSHISDEGFWDIMKITEKPIIATHSNSRSFCDCPRNLTEDMFRAICETGGLAGFNMCPEFIGEDPALDINTVCDHFFHILNLDSSGKHLALGGDLDGVDFLPAGFYGVQSYEDLAYRLLDRGLDENMLMDIYWNNAIGVMERAVCDHKK